MTDEQMSWADMSALLDTVPVRQRYDFWQMAESHLRSTLGPVVHVVTELEAEDEESEHDEGDVLCPWCGAVNDIADADVSTRWCEVEFDHANHTVSIANPDNENESVCYICRACCGPVEMPEGYEVTFAW